MVRRNLEAEILNQKRVLEPENLLGSCKKDVAEPSASQVAKDQSRRDLILSFTHQVLQHLRKEELMRELFPRRGVKYTAISDRTKQVLKYRHNVMSVELLELANKVLCEPLSHIRDCWTPLLHLLTSTRAQGPRPSLPRTSSWLFSATMLDAYNNSSYPCQMTSDEEDATVKLQKQQNIIEQLLTYVEPENVIAIQFFSDGQLTRNSARRS